MRTFSLNSREFLRGGHAGAGAACVGWRVAAGAAVGATGGMPVGVSGGPSGGGRRVSRVAGACRGGDNASPWPVASFRLDFGTARLVRGPERDSRCDSKNIGRISGNRRCSKWLRKFSTAITC
jgi:hypothetical protein